MGLSPYLKEFPVFLLVIAKFSALFRLPLFTINLLWTYE